MSLGGKGRSLQSLRSFGFNVPSFITINDQSSESQKKVHEFLKENSSLRFAVRSSANLEDGTENSFAGLFETFLNLDGETQVWDAIKNCFDGIKSQRVFSYCQKRNINTTLLQMSVIVQTMVEAEHAGVAFTLNPVNGRDDEIVVEFVEGLGDKLVAGLANPSQWILCRWADPSLKHENNSNYTLNHSWANQLRDVFCAIQACFGKPQDIEWAIQNGKLFILQSRDITSHSMMSHLGDWTTADFRDGGVSSAVVSPVTWSLYDRVFSASLPAYFRDLGLLKKSPKKWFQVFYGRPYWNLSAVKEIQQTLPGFIEKNFDEDLAITPQYDGNGKTTPVTLGGIMKAIPVLFRLKKAYKNQKKLGRSLISEFTKIEQEWKNLSWSTQSNAELNLNAKKLIHEVYFNVESTYFRTIYNLSNAKMEFLDSLKPYLKKDSTLEYIKLISDIGESAATKPILELKTLNPADFAQKFYYHSKKELDLRVPRWGEDVSALEDILKKKNSAADSSQLKSNKSRIHDQELLKLRTIAKQSLLLKLKVGSVLQKLENFREFLWLREELRDCSTRVYFFIRQMLLEVGRRYDLNDYVFYLNIEDVLMLVSGQASVKEIKDRADKFKKYALGFRSFKNPNELGPSFSKTKRSESTSEASLSGIACSAGIYRGRARIVHDPADSQRINPGDILVAPFSDPGWTPIFSLVGAVVTETGGLLSHAALISREYGIPSVLNVPNATTKIKDGDFLEIDGSLGKVYFIQESAIERTPSVQGEAHA